MKSTYRVTFLSLFLLISMMLPFATTKAFARENVMHTNPPLNVGLSLSFQPAIGGVLLPLKFSLDQNGNISVSATAWSYETPLGVVSLDTNLSVPLLPQISPQAQQTAMTGSDLLLIIRHMQHGSLVDANYLLTAKQNIQSVDIQGVITEVSVRWTGKNYMVYVNASRGNISSITLGGVSAGTTESVKMGCPGPSMIAWSINESLGSVKEVNGSPCSYVWTNPHNGSPDGQCPTGYGSANIQMSFPWWHFWDQGENHSCDGKSATTLDDLNTADSATITFRFNAMPSTSSPTIQYCNIVLAEGLNIRTASNTESAIVAHYQFGATLNFIKVVNGEIVNGNDLWGLSEQGHYFWLGGTDHPNG